MNCQSKPIPLSPWIVDTSTSRGCMCFIKKGFSLSSGQRTILNTDGSILVMSIKQEVYEPTRRLTLPRRSPGRVILSILGASAMLTKNKINGLFSLQITSAYHLHQGPIFTSNAGRGSCFLNGSSSTCISSLFTGLHLMQ